MSWDWIHALEEARVAGLASVLVTVVGVKGSAPREVGAKMLVFLDGTFKGTIGGGHLEELALAEAAAVLHTRENRSVSYPLGAKTGQCCGGSVDLYFEVQNTGPRLYVFGAGHVGQAVCRALTGTPFQLHLIDERPEWIRSPELPRSVVRHEMTGPEFLSDLPADAEKNYVVIMTHRHDLDQDLVEALLKKPLRYLGLIGSQAKWERFRQRLSARGVSESDFARVHCPIGLPVGGKAPAEIALSLGAELLKIHYGR